MPSRDEIFVSTSELAEAIEEALERSSDTRTILARRAQIDSRQLRRILARETKATTSDVAMRLLEAAGRDISDLPSYFEGWILYESRHRHGTRYARWRMKCDCDRCVEWGRLNYRRRQATPSAPRSAS